MAYEYIKENLQIVTNKMARAAEKSGRDVIDITLVAVSKTHPAEAIRAAVESGVTDIGESRIQEAIPKIELLGGIARWHMIGHLQTNKVKRAVSVFDMIQSVDSLNLAREIDRRAGEEGKRIDCFLEVKSSGEESKFGFGTDELIDLLGEISSLENINLCGLMTIGPLVDDENLIRKAFRLTRELFLKGREVVGESFTTLSMGMSDDFEMAIEEGSTMVRVGRAIFGQRGA
jgi:pyridoxal phosphate enzyme (YggS family)